MIWTTNFAHAADLPAGTAKFSIARKCPVGWENSPDHGLYKRLAPSYSILGKWQANRNEQLYSESFYKEVLNKLNPEMLVFQLEQMAKYRKCKDIALICYERPEKFCHRHLVAEWLRNNGFECEEFDYAAKTA